MNHASESARIRNHPRYKDLVSRQRRFVACLTAATLVPYFTFILGAGLFTGLYLLRANGEFDELTAEICAGVIV